MTRRRILFTAAGLALLAGAAFAQGSGGTTDPVSGNWGANGRTFLELLYDGKGAISGTAIWWHDEDQQRTPIKAGSFNPRTGALKLSGEAKNRAGEMVQYLIEGKIQNGTASGTFRVGEEKGEFAFTRQ